LIKVSRPFAGWLLPVTAGGEAIPARIYLHLNFPSRACCQLNPIKPSIMPIQIKEENGGKMLTVHVTGKLVVTDYEGFVPEFKRLVRQYGKLSVLFDMTDFHGWTPGCPLVGDQGRGLSLQRHRSSGDSRREEMAARHGFVLQDLHDRDRPLLRSCRGRQRAPAAGRYPCPHATAMNLSLRFSQTHRIQNL